MNDTPGRYHLQKPNGQREILTTGKTLNRGGAGGRIVESTSHPEFVGKIFHDSTEGQNMLPKLVAMLENPPNFPPGERNGKKYVQLAWPKGLLEDDYGQVIGYAMPFVDLSRACSLEHLLQRSVRNRLGLPEKYAYRIFAGYNAAAVITALHKRGHCVIDLKPPNISVYSDTMMIALVDCDGFAVRGKNRKRFPAGFVSDEYVCPEGMSIKPAKLDVEHDRFALAVILFRLLNEGLHPFAGVPNKNAFRPPPTGVQERIGEKLYPYGKKPNERQAPHPFSLHEYWPRETRDLFEKAFLGHPKDRPDAQTWREHLRKLLERMKDCKENPNHQYFGQNCGLCAKEKRVMAKSNQSRQSARKKPERKATKFQPETIVPPSFVRSPAPQPATQAASSPPPSADPWENSAPPIIIPPSLDPADPANTAHDLSRYRLKWRLFACIMFSVMLLNIHVLTQPFAPTLTRFGFGGVLLGGMLVMAFHNTFVVICLAPFMYLKRYILLRYICAFGGALGVIFAIARMYGYARTFSGFFYKLYIKLGIPLTAFAKRYVFPFIEGFFN